MEKEKKVILAAAGGGVLILSIIFYFLFFERSSEFPGLCPEGTYLKQCKLGPCCCPQGSLCD